MDGQIQAIQFVAAQRRLAKVASLFCTTELKIHVIAPTGLQTTIRIDIKNKLKMYVLLKI